MTTANRVTDIPAPPSRPRDAHKGTFGHVLVVAGSEGMSGAACLAGYGALRGGSGLVTLAVPRSIAPIVAGMQPSWMTCALPEEKGSVDASAVVLLDELAQRVTVCAVGPGMRQTSAVTEVVQHIWHTFRIPVVLDADSLNVLAANGGWNQTPVTAARVLTPHPGEFARLSGFSPSEIAAKRERLAIEFANRHQVILLLKGAGTIITDGARIAINSTGTSGMATGGAGDVLTGLIAALLAQGMEAFDAAFLAAHLHGLAGESAERACSGPAMTADDLQRHLGEAWKSFPTSGTMSRR